MFNFFGKKRKPDNSEKKDEAEHTGSLDLVQPTWYEIGDGNPFNERVLDIRSVTLNIVATTREKWIADNYSKSRSDDGTQYINQEIRDCKRYESNIRYPHNGNALEGIVSKAESMDVKWDIYAYGEWFYFARSWTSELVYKVHYQNTGTELVFDFIITNLDEDGHPNLHEQNIHSIILTHVLGRVWPYTIPKKMRTAGEKDIALYLFSQFGQKATIATYANTLEIKLIDI